MDVLLKKSLKLFTTRKSIMKTIPICKGLPGLVHTSSNQVSPRNKIHATYTDWGLLSFVKNTFNGLNFAYKSPNKSPKTGIPIHRKTHKIKGAIEVFAPSLPIKPGAMSKNKITNPNNLPIKVCWLLNSFSSEVKIDSFQEIFKNTNVKIITHAETFNIMSKGIGRSPWKPTPWLKLPINNDLMSISP